MDFYDQMMREDYGVHQMAEKVLGENDKIYRNGAGIGSGIGDGPYDVNHKLLRQMWHKTQTRLIGKNRINEIINASSKMVCETIRKQDTVKGIDPRDIFMNGTLNVVTGFSLGITYKYDDSDFIRLANYVKDFFANMKNIYVSKIVTQILPMWMIKSRIVRRIRNGIRGRFHQE